MHPIDIAVVVLYVLGVTAVGAWLGRGATGLKGYFLGESNVPAWAVMISIVATETSAVTFLSVPGNAYRRDLTFIQLAMGLVLGRIVVATVLLPSYFKGEIYTAYQILQTRFGPATKTAASVLFLITKTLGDGLRLFLAATVLRQITGWSIEASIVATATTTIVYTYLGGMKAVIWTDVAQFFVYITGALFALYLLVNKFPGGIAEILERAGPTKLRMFNFSTDVTAPYTFWSGVLGGMVLNTATHGADQTMVQRYLTAKSQRQAAGALLASGVVVFAQFALFLFIGIGLYVFYQDVPPTRVLGKDEEFAYFIVNYLPIGTKGLLIAALFSVTMSSLSGSLNASASTTVNDLYRPLVPNASERHLLAVSKGMTAFWGVAKMSVAFLAISLQKSVVDNAFTIAAFVTGIILGVFLLGVLTKRVGQAGALAGLVAGVAVVSYVALATKVDGLWYALIGSSTVFVVGCVVSLFFPAKNQAIPADVAG